MFKLLRVVLVTGVAFFASLTAQFSEAAPSAQDFGTREEAKAMVDAAIAHVQKAGTKKAFQDFVKDKANWTRKDLYVFVFDDDGNMVAHGNNERLMGKNLVGIKDRSGKEFVKEFISVAKTKGEGWVNYEWPNPQTGQIEAKTSLVKRVKGTNYLLGVGIYR